MANTKSPNMMYESASFMPGMPFTSVTSVGMTQEGQSQEGVCAVSLTTVRYDTDDRYKIGW